MQQYTTKHAPSQSSFKPEEEKALLGDTLVLEHSQELSALQRTLQLAQEKAQIKLGAVLTSVGVIGIGYLAMLHSSASAPADPASGLGVVGVGVVALMSLTTFGLNTLIKHGVGYHRVLTGTPSSAEALEEASRIFSASLSHDTVEVAPKRLKP